MFKRLRDNLFKRDETQDDAPAETEPSASPPSAADAAPSAGEATTAPATPIATLSAPEQRNNAEVASTSSAPPRVSAAAPIASVASAGAPARPTVSPPEDEDDEFDLDDADEEVDARKRGFFRNPFKLGLGRTRQLFGQVNAAFESDDITDDLWDELEETLISGDVGVQTTERLMKTLHQRVEAEQLTRGVELRDALKEELELLLGEPEPLIFSESSPITVILVVGVNGVGKTTSIAKVAQHLKRHKHRVMLAAADTFRAAATEQIKTWGERIGVPVISHQHGADPAAVVYDAMQAAQARGSDVLIVDTAGRLHTKFNLMEELKKMMRVLQKYDPEAPHEVLLVIDATTGQNGFLQAKQFVQDSGVSGVILTKLDGTARGGIVFAVASELGLPIKFIGTGEKVADLAAFDPIQFVDALFDED